MAKQPVSLIKNLGSYLSSSPLLQNLFASNVDPLFQPNTSTRFNYYIGQKPVYNDPTTDFYKTEPDLERTINQLTPATTTIDPTSTDVTNIIFHDDYVSALTADFALTDNQNRLFEQQYYTWCPPIDLDKFVNFEQYIWLENGPSAIEITDQTFANETIVGQATYTTPSGLVFTNGLRVMFLNDIEPSMDNINFIVEGVGSSIRLVMDGDSWDQGPWDGIEGNASTLGHVSTPALVSGQQATITIIYNNVTYTVPLIDTDHDGIIIAAELLTSLQEAGLPDGLQFFYDAPTDRTIIVTTTDEDFTLQEGNSTAVTDLFGQSSITSVTVVRNWDNFVSTVKSDFEDYTTIQRSSLDNNPWSASNRWFPLSLASATDIANAPNSHAVRPIIEFRRDLELYKYGNFRRTGVDVVYNYSAISLQLNGSSVTVPADAGFLNNFNYDLSKYTVLIDGTPVFNGMTILVQSDTNQNVANRIFILQISNNMIFFDLSNSGLNIDGSPRAGEIVAVEFGTVNGSTEYFYNGGAWVLAQTRTAPNQPPLFNLYDNESNALGDLGIYPNSTFAGCKLYGYQLGTGTADSILGFPTVTNTAGELVFQNFQATDFSDPAYRWYKQVTDTVGTIQFSNSWHLVPNLSSQALIDVLPYNVSTIYTMPSGAPLDQMYIPFTTNTTIYTIPETFINQSFTISANSIVLHEGIDYTINTTFNEIIFTDAVATLNVNTNFFLSINKFGRRNIVVTSGTTTLLPGIQYTTGGPNYATLFLTTAGDALVDQTIGIQVAIGGYASNANGGAWEVPSNITANSNNDVITTVGWNEIFQQFTDIIQNQSGFSGSPFSVNNYRDTNRAQNVGDVIFQHSGSLLIPSILSGLENLDVLESVAFAEREYARIKNKMIQMFSTIIQSGQLLPSSSVNTWVSQILLNLTLGKTNNSPFAWSLMGGKTWIPPTPAFLGIASVYTPTTLLKNNITYLRFHDGSLLAAFGDYRDSVLLAIDTQIYNSIPETFRIQDRPLFDFQVQTSGRFRTAIYSPQEVASIEQSWFERWCVRNKLVDYRSNINYDPTNKFTWNYSTCHDSAGNTLPGSYSAIFNFYYDTETPDQTPWEMLGFTSQPSWWQSEYGVAPYGKNHTIIWQDLEAGTIRQGERAGTDLNYARPGLNQFIPVDVYGNLLDPVAIGIVIDPPSSQFASANWVFGDNGPIEQLWRNSESYPFTQVAVGWLARPAEFQAFAWDPLNTIIDTRNIVSGPQIYNSQLGCRPNHSLLTVNSEVTNAVGNTNSGYQAYVSNYLMNQGKNVTTNFGVVVRGLEPRLANKLAGFIDGANLVVQADNFGSLPDNNVNLFLYKGTSIATPFYSGVIIRWTGSAWQVIGYDVNNPKFPVIAGDSNGPKQTIVIEGEQTAIPAQWEPNTQYQAGQLVTFQTQQYRARTSHTSSNTFDTQLWILYAPTNQNPPFTVQQYVNTQKPETITYVEYYTSFANVQDVYNFLIGYQRALEAQGWVFDDFNTSANCSDDWALAGKRFLLWSRANVAPGFIIALSPASRHIKFVAESGVVQPVETTTLGVYSILNKDGASINRKKTNITRINGELDIYPSDTSDTGGIYAASISVCNIEQILIFDNTTSFGNLVYSPLLNIQQPRLRISSIGNFDWNGRPDVPGYILSGNTITIDFSNPILGTHDELTTNFEKTADDFRYYYDIENAVSDPVLREHARYAIGYAPRDYLQDVFSNDVSQFQFYQGMIREKGSPNSLDKLLRSNYLNQNSDIEFFEEWAILEGQYGAYGIDKNIQFQLLNGDIKTDPELIEILNIEYDPTLGNSQNPNSNIITLYLDDPRWEVKPDSATAISPMLPLPLPKMPMALPTAGYVKLGESTQTVFDITALQALWASFDANQNLVDLTGNVNQVDQEDEEEGGLIWIYNYPQQYGLRSTLDWNMLRITGSPVDIAFSEPNGNYTSSVFVMESKPITVNDGRSIPFLVDNTYVGVLQLGQPKISGIYLAKLHESRVEMNLVTGTTITLFTAINPEQIVEISADVESAITFNPTEPMLFNVLVNDTVVLSNINLSSGSVTLTNISIPMNIGDVLTIKTSNTTTLVSGAISFKARYSDIRTNEGDLNIGTTTVELLTVPATGQLLNITANLEVLIAVNNALGIDDHINYVVTSTDSEGNATTLVTVTDIQNINTLGNLTLDLDYPIFLEIDQTLTASIVFDISSTFATPTALTTGLIGTTINYVHDFEFELEEAVTGTPVLVNNGNVTGQLWIFQPMRFLDNSANPGGRDFAGNSIYPASAPIVGTNNPNGWNTNDLVYIDNFIDNGTVPATSTGTYQVQRYNGSGFDVVRNQNLKTNPQFFKQAVVLDTVANVTQGILDIFDPAKGFIAGVALNDLNYITAYDPAVYTSSTTNLEAVVINPGQAWGPENQGFTWWDISQIRYLDYEIDDPSIDQNLQYRLANWGQLAPGSTVNIYEWTRAIALPKTVSSYVIREEIDTNTGNTIQAFYFWVLNPTTQNPFVPRTQSAFDIATAIQTPESVGLRWFAPISQNNFIVSNIKDLLGDQNTVLQINWRTTDSQNLTHKQWILMRNGDDSSLPTDPQWDKMLDCLVGQDATGLPVPDPSLSVQQKFGNSIRPRKSWFNVEAGLTFPQQARLEFVTTINRILLGVNLVQTRIGFADAITLSEPLPTITGRTVFTPDFDGIYRIPSNFSIDTTLIYNVPTSGLVDILRLNVDYTVTYNPQLDGSRLNVSSFYTVTFLKSFTGFYILNDPNNCQVQVADLFTRNNTILNTGDQITVVNDSSVNNYWVNYVYLGLLNNVQVYAPINWQAYRTEDYWQNTDWYGIDLNGNQYNALNVPRFVFSTINERNQTASFRTGDLVQILNTDQNPANFQWFVYSLDENNNPLWTLVAQQNGTIQLSSNLYAATQTPVVTPDAVLFGELNDLVSNDLTLAGQFNFSTWTPVNFNLPGFHPDFNWTQAPYLSNTIPESILQRFYLLFIDNFGIYTANDDFRQLANGLRAGVLEPIEINETWFEMIAVAHVQCPEVVWAFKTSFLTIANFREALGQPAIQTLNLIPDVIDYITENKPYHVQIRDFIQRLTPATELANVHVIDFDNPPYLDPVLGVYRPLDVNNAGDITILNDSTQVWFDWYQQYQAAIASGDVTDALFRKMTITLAFDRVSSMWQNGWDPPTGWDIYGWDFAPEYAAERIIEFYSPDDTMRALMPVSNLISGANFRGTILQPVSTAFDKVVPGWDSMFLFDGDPWDSDYPISDAQDFSEVDIEIQGGSGAPYANFDLDLAKVNVYADPDQQLEFFGYNNTLSVFTLPTDDPQLIPFAGVKVNGNLVSNWQVIPNSNLIQFSQPLNDGDKIEITFGPTFLPAPQRDSDTNIDGGQFTNGDWSDDRPEELVLLTAPDDFRMDVYLREFVGAPKVINNRFKGSNSVGPYAVGQQPQNIDALLVWKDGLFLERTVDYTFDYPNSEVTFTQVVASTDFITMVSYSNAGAQQNVTTSHWTGSTNTVVTTEFNVGDILVLQNGKVVSATWTVVNDVVTITVQTIAQPTDFFSAVIFDQAPKSVVRTDEFELKDANLFTPLTFTLSQPVESSFPAWATTLVHINGSKINGPAVNYYIGSSLEKFFPARFAVNDMQNINAWSNGNNLILTVIDTIGWSDDQWTNANGVLPIGYDGFVFQSTTDTGATSYTHAAWPGSEDDWNRFVYVPTQLVYLNNVYLRNPAPLNASVIVARMEQYEYIVDGNQLTIFNDVSATDRVTATTVNENNIFAIKTDDFVGNTTSTYSLTANPDDYNSVFAYVNGQLQLYLQDWNFISAGVIHFFADHTDIDDINITYLDAPGNESVPPVAFRIFSDRFNKREDIRISDRFRYKLRADIGTTDTTIQVYINGDLPSSLQNVMPKPDYTKALPGVIWIEGERIEYYTIAGPNQDEEGTWFQLGKIRRATRGTLQGQLTPLDTVRYNGDGVTTTFALPSDATNYQQIIVELANYRTTDYDEWDVEAWDTGPWDLQTDAQIYIGDYPLVSTQWALDGNNVVLTTAPMLPNPPPSGYYDINPPLVLIEGRKPANTFVHQAGVWCVDGSMAHKIPGGYEFQISKQSALGWDSGSWDDTVMPVNAFDAEGFDTATFDGSLVGTNNQTWDQLMFGYREINGQPYDSNFGVQFNRNRLSGFLKESPGTPNTSFY